MATGPESWFGFSDFAYERDDWADEWEERSYEDREGVDDEDYDWEDQC